MSKDENGNTQSVTLSAKDWNQILEELEELDDIRAFDQAVAEDSKSIPFEKAIAQIEQIETESLKYAVEILRSAQKSLARIQAEDRETISDAIRKLGDNPRQAGTRKLTGREAWRLRVGRYRVIYQVFDDRLVVSVILVGHRRDIYR